MASRQSEDNEARQSLISDDKVTWNLHLPKRKQKSLSTARKILPIVLGAIVSSALSVGLTILLLRHHWAVTRASDSAVVQTPPDKVNCGSNPTEARALGCVFQIWDYAWVPASCVDEGLDAEFRRLTENDNISYFLEYNGTEKISLETVYSGELKDRLGLDEVYSTWGWHYWHCAIQLRKFFRARSDLTDADLNLRHVVHCEKWFTDPFHFDWYKVNVKIPLEYRNCNAFGLNGPDIMEVDGPDS